MPKSKKRGGEKSHRKKVENRNNLMKNMFQRQVKLAYEKHEEWKQQQSGSTESNEIRIDVK
jgi:hypothetical protein